MRRVFPPLFLLIAVFVNCIASSYLNNSDLWEKAERNIHEQKYDSAIVAYETLVSEMDSIYKEINSTQVEDLRRNYSIDELELANSKKKN